MSENLSVVFYRLVKIMVLILECCLIKEDILLLELLKSQVFLQIIGFKRILIILLLKDVISGIFVEELLGNHKKEKRVLLIILKLSRIL